MNIPEQPTTVNMSKEKQIEQMDLFCGSKTFGEPSINKRIPIVFKTFLLKHARKENNQPL